MTSLWFILLFQPLLNALIWIYTNAAGQNLGVAVIIMTIGLRVVMLPFSLLSEKNEAKQRSLEKEGKVIMAMFKNDSVAQKEEIRKLMKKNHISPWARFLTLVAQVLLFLVLYQVFIHGINNEQVAKSLYSGVTYPGKLNTSFLGFDIGQNHTSLWAGVAALYLLVSIVAQGILRGKSWEKSDVYFIIFFPLFIFGGLWFLPMVKSIFFLTTVVCSDIVKALFFVAQREKKEKHGHDVSNSSHSSSDHHHA